MSYPSQALRQDGYLYLAGLEGTSGAAYGRWGPNLFAIDPTPSAGEVNAATLISHDIEAHQAPDVIARNATSEWWIANGPANQQWWIANKVTDMEWFESDTHHGIISFVYRGLGETWYGESYDGPGGEDPYVEGYGYHAEGWTLEAWIYDPDEVMEVYRGERDPWSLEPAEAVLLIERLPGVDYETYYSFLTGPARSDLKMSLRDGRLIILQEDGYPANEWENTPKGYVIDVSTSSVPCPGDFDDDGDVDGSDLAVFAEDFGRTDCSGDCEGGFDGDGDVDGSDLAVFAEDFGRTDCP
jgi:hypothetical protein